MKKTLAFILLILCGAGFAFWLAGRQAGSRAAGAAGAAGPKSEAPPQPVAVAAKPAPSSAPYSSGAKETAPAAPQPAAAPPTVFTSSVMPGAVMRTTTPSINAPSPPPPPAAVAPTRTPLPEDPAVAEAETVALNIRHFGQRFGGNPTGTNAEIVKALTGGNEKGATYLPPDLKRLNENGELVDRWGTPYFFHSNSATDMEVRSAGPDKRLYTEDDIVQH